MSCHTSLELFEGLTNLVRASLEAFIVVRLFFAQPFSYDGGTSFVLGGIKTDGYNKIDLC